MNSNMVKPEKFDHLLLVYHFTVPLKRTEVCWLVKKTFNITIQVASMVNIKLFFYGLILL